MPFTSTLRSLKADGSRRFLLGLLLASALLGAWLVWAVLAEVCVYETTNEARLEVQGGIHTVQASVSGSVVRSSLVLGADVKRGAVLVELDATELDRSLDEKRAERAAFVRELDALENELGAERRALRSAKQAEATAVAEAQARELEAIPATELAEKRAERISDKVTAFSEAEIDTAKADATARRRALDRLRRGVTALSLDHETRIRDRETVLSRLEREAATLHAEADKLNPAIERLRVAVEKRRIRSPADGVIGRITELPAGAYVKEGDALFTVVPRDRDLKVIARFDPKTALGRIAPGQPAELRLDGFPWAQYGSVTAQVTSVGNEAIDGRVRVELSVSRVSTARIPLQHGLATSVDVEVERAVPAILLLRAAGRLVDPRAGASP